ncbi:MAG: cyclase family protein [Pyrinomonadaceae bacterium]
MNRLFDLSHPITDNPPCTFRTADAIPKVRFSEGESHGVFFITSQVENLYSNTCTHIDFPGHLSEFGSRFLDSIGAYPIERFVGNVAILDFSSKLDALGVYFNDQGEFITDPSDPARMLNFLKSLEGLEISAAELAETLADVKVSLDSLKGVLVYSGLSRFWKYEIVESWNYIYFFNPFFSQEACQLIVDNEISFVGIDALQVEHPIIDYAGDELPVVLFEECRDYIAQKHRSLKGPMNHRLFLGHDVLIYENMRIPKELAGQTVWFSGVPLNFQISGLDDNALVRPYAHSLL